MANKPKKNNKASIDLTKAYQTATMQITDIIEKSKPATTYDLQLILHKRLNQVTFELDKLNSEVITQSCKQGIRDGKTKISSHLKDIFNGRSLTEKDVNSPSLDSANTLLKKAILNEEKQRRIQDATYRQNYLDVRSNLMGVRLEVDKTIKSTIKELAKKGNNTVLNVQKTLAEKFKEEGVFKVTFSNGAKIGFDAYTNMVARTARTESNNLYNERICESLGTKLVKCLSNAVTCPVCGVYKDRVFCVDGSDRRFPALREGQDAPLKHGYNTIHPNCRCEFLPYFEELQTPRELAKDIAFSNRPFEDTRTREQQKDYQEWQAKNRKLRDELSEYNAMETVLKDKMPYETLGGFRRAKRAFQDLKNSNTLDKSDRILYNKYRLAKVAYKDKLLQADIRRGKYNLTVHGGKQGKHIQGHNNFASGKSYLIIDESEVQNLVNRYAGRGVIQRTDNGKWNHKEMITTDRNIGVCINSVGKTVATWKFMLHYSKTGVHIVPTLKEE